MVTDEYFNEIMRSMKFLADQENTFFIGQAVEYPGTFMFNTLREVPMEKRLEMPVCESLQMQISIGMAMEGGIFPISIFPRQNFLLLATSDMVNMLDKIPAISDGKHLPKMIIRTATGPSEPIHPGYQHVGNYADAFRQMFTWIDVKEINTPEEAFLTYHDAYFSNKTTLIIENGW